MLPCTVLRPVDARSYLDICRSRQISEHIREILSPGHLQRQGSVNVAGRECRYCITDLRALYNSKLVILKIYSRDYFAGSVAIGRMLQVLLSKRFSLLYLS